MPLRTHQYQAHRISTKKGVLQQVARIGSIAKVAAQENTNQSNIYRWLKQKDSFLNASYKQNRAGYRLRKRAPKYAQLESVDILSCIKPFSGAFGMFWRPAGGWIPCHSSTAEGESTRDRARTSVGARQLCTFHWLCATFLSTKCNQSTRSHKSRSRRQSATRLCLGLNIQEWAEPKELPWFDQWECWVWGL